jgi:hexokinase
MKLHDSKVVDRISRAKLLDSTVESGEVLFSNIADFIVSFLGENKSYLTPNADLPTGFTFSFPVKQTSISSGYLVRWTKGQYNNINILLCFLQIEFRAEGVVNNDAVQLLTEQLEKKGYGWVKINAMCNDTVCKW